MELRANKILIELINLCATSVDRINIVRRYGEYIYAVGGSEELHNLFHSHDIDEADYTSLLAYFGVDDDPACGTSKRILLHDTVVIVTPNFTKFISGETLTLHLVFSSSSAADSN